MAIPDDMTIEAYIDGAATLAGIAIAPEFRPGVVLNFKRTADVARLVTEFQLPDEIESAPVFCP